jgi:hypothetical protein
LPIPPSIHTQKGVSIDRIVGSLKQLIARALARHLKIFGATLQPNEGKIFYPEEGEAKRRALNEWIRTSGSKLLVNVPVRDDSSTAGLNQ